MDGLFDSVHKLSANDYVVWLPFCENSILSTHLLLLHMANEMKQNDQKTVTFASPPATPPTIHDGARLVRLAAREWW